MGNKKRSQDSEDEEDVEYSVAGFSAQQKKAPSKVTGATARTAKKPKFDESEAGSQTAVKVFKNAEGEKYVDLGKKKRVTVRPFKGQVYVDIREFYGTDGDEKPGKKGISLTAEQWKAFKQSISTVDSFLAELDKK